MPYLQKATANYFGFAPARNPGGETQVNPYLVSSSEGAISAGDVCVMTSIATVKAGTGAIGATSVIIGVAANSLAANGGSTAARVDITSSQVVHIYDSPSQVFYGCDTSSGTLGSLAVGKSVAVLATGCVASTGINPTLARSVMALSGLTASSDGAMRVLGLHPVEQNSFAALAATGAENVRKWYVIFARHILAAGVNVPGVVTS